MMVMFAVFAMSVSAPKDSMVVQAAEMYVTDTGTYWYKILEDETVAITGYAGVEGVTEITVPSKIIVDSSGNGRTVTSIDYDAFRGCSSLTNITLPEGVTSIGGSAFYDCSSLTNITLPEGVTSIGGSAFYDCSNLTSITIPETVTSIGESAFNGCSNLTSITIPDSVTSIGGFAFDGTAWLEKSSLVIVNGILVAASPEIENVTIPDSVTSIGEWAFNRCVRLTVRRHIVGGTNRTLISAFLPPRLRSHVGNRRLSTGQPHTVVALFEKQKSCF